MNKLMKGTALVLALAVGGASTAQAQAFNIWSASQGAKLETVKHGGKHRRHHGHNHHRHHHDDWDKAAFAIGTIGAIAGAAAYASRNSYYYDDDYYYEDDYDGPGGYYYYDQEVCDNPYQPKHYPAPQGC